jgi:hypothetical protein
LLSFLLVAFSILTSRNDHCELIRATNVTGLQNKCHIFFCDGATIFQYIVQYITVQ